MTLLPKRASVFLNQILSRSISGLVNVSKHHMEWAIEEVNADVVFLNFGYWWFLPHLANVLKQCHQAITARATYTGEALRMRMFDERTVTKQAALQRDNDFYVDVLLPQMKC